MVAYLLACHNIKHIKRSEFEFFICTKTILIMYKHLDKIRWHNFPNLLARIVSFYTNNKMNEINNTNIIFIDKPDCSNTTFLLLFFFSNKENSYIYYIFIRICSTKEKIDSITTE